MNKNQKNLLRCVIEEYLKSGEPIGSQTLKVNADMKISSATIRNHFKIMMDEGLLSQMHISSGRIPTNLAFKSHWREEIDITKRYSFSSFLALEEKSKEIGCFIGVYYPNHLKLLGINAVNETFLTLSFDEDKEVILRYSDPLKRFFSDLIGMELEDIQSFCLQVRAIDVFQALQALNRSAYQFCGAKYIAPFMQSLMGERLFFSLCNGEIFKRLGNGIYFDETFPKEYFGFVLNGEVAGKDSRILVCGNLQRDYSILMKGENK